MHSLIVGCGDTGVRVAARAVAAGDRVTGVVRGPQSARQVRSVGARALMLDLDGDDISLPACDRLFYFAPPPRQGETDPRLARVLDGFVMKRPEYLVYISTSGVYGDCDGAWVSEQRAVNPQTARGKRRVDAEGCILGFDSGATILRAPGIYGPNRLPVERLRTATPIVDDADAGWSNRVHIDDLAAIAWQAANEHWPHPVYNASDGNPTLHGVYYDALAQLLDLPAPPRITWAQAEEQFSAMRLSFLRESRRLDNSRLRQDTGYAFTFADFRDGLTASLHAQAPLG